MDPGASDIQTRAESSVPQIIQLTGCSSSNPITFVLVDGPKHGKIKINTNSGVAIYLADADYGGEDEFVYRVVNCAGDESDPATVTIDVIAKARPTPAAPAVLPASPVLATPAVPAAPAAPAAPTSTPSTTPAPVGPAYLPGSRAPSPIPRRTAMTTGTPTTTATPTPGPTPAAPAPAAPAPATPAAPAAPAVPPLVVPPAPAPAAPAAPAAPVVVPPAPAAPTQGVNWPLLGVFILCALAIAAVVYAVSQQPGCSGTAPLPVPPVPPPPTASSGPVPPPPPPPTAGLCPTGYTEVSLAANSCQLLGWDGDVMPYEAVSSPVPGRLVTGKTPLPAGDVNTKATPVAGKALVICWPNAVPLGSKSAASQVLWHVYGQYANHVVQPTWYTDCRRSWVGRCGIPLEDPTCVKPNPDGSTDMTSCNMLVPVPIP